MENRGVKKGKLKDNPKDSLRKRWMVATIVMVVINIILLASIMAVTITWRNEKAWEAKNMNKEPDMCLPCDDVYYHPDDVRDNIMGFTKRMNRNKDMCCGRASKHLDQLIALYSEKVHQKQRNIEMLTSNPYKCDKETVKPSAHLVGVTKSVKGLHHHHMIQWNESCHLSNLNGVEYDDGKLLVNLSGFYYIYSQITYHDQMNLLSYNENDFVLHHSIHREYNGDDITREKLLESTESRCQFVGDRVNKTSYIGAVFYLKVNDKLHVRVSHPQRILLSQHGNYFGLYLT